MRYKFLIITIISLCFVSLIRGEESFNKVGQWSFDELIYGHVFNAVVDNDGDLIVMFFRNGIRVINKNKAIKFANVGQGPGEIQNWCSLCLFKEKIADVEHNRKIQVFEKNNGIYKWQKNIWREEKGCWQKIMSSLYTDGKWFFAGEVTEYADDSKQKSIPFLRIYNEVGGFLKQPLIIDFEKSRRFNLMSYYLTQDKKYIFFLSEDAPTIYLISKQSLEVVKKVELPVPKFYKKIPDDFYRWELGNTRIQLEHQIWKTGYSRITNAIMVKDSLVIQMRTCQPGKDKFALVFYDLNNFQILKTIYTKDFFLTEKNEKYYFFKDGNPSLDDEAGKLAINIYAFPGIKNEKK